MFSTALAANNVADAVIFAETIHEDGHAFSGAIDIWRDSFAVTNPVADIFDISVGQFVMDSAGFHGMAESLTTNQTIDTTYNSIVKRVKKVLENTIWPTSLEVQVNEFIENLGLFSAALASNNVAEAVILSDTVHDAQHELSATTDEWVALE